MTDISVVVPFRHEGDTDTARYTNWEFCRKRWRTWADQHGRVEIVVGDEGDPFHRGKSRNQAIDNADGDIVVIADADTYPDFGLISQAIVAVAGGAPWALPYDIYLNVDETDTARIVDGSMPPWRILHGSVGYDHRITDAVSGMLVVPRPILDVVRYDERFEAWGYEDNAFAAALDTMIGPVHRIPGHVLHLWHPVAPDGAFNQPNINRNRSLWRKYQRAAGNPARMGRLIGAANVV